MTALHGFLLGGGLGAEGGAGTGEVEGGGGRFPFPEQAVVARL